LVKRLVRFEDGKSSHRVDLKKMLNSPHIPHGVDFSSPKKYSRFFKNNISKRLLVQIKIFSFFHSTQIAPEQIYVLNFENCVYETMKI
jgi:hypothetical protein